MTCVVVVATCLVFDVQMICVCAQRFVDSKFLVLACGTFDLQETLRGTLINGVLDEIVLDDV